MCPDRQILSVYLDKELPSPWKEKMEDHLLSCAECQGLLKNYQAISTLVSPKNTGSIELYVTPAKDRIWENLSSLEVREKKTVYHNWSHSVSLPLPAAIAAGLVIAFMAAFVGGVVLRPTPNVHTVANLEAQSVLPSSDIARIIEYLDAQENSANMVIIQLPESQNFVSSGEPTLIRAADYTRGDYFR